MKRISLLLIGLVTTSCATLPTPKHKSYLFPDKEAFVGNTTRPCKTMGRVKTKVDYPSLDPGKEEADLCKNYYNKAVTDLVHLAKNQGGDAVIDVKSVVFLEDGRREVYVTPECSDDGMEGQIPAQGIVIKWTDIPPREN